MQNCKKQYIFAKRFRENIAHGDARGTQRGDIGSVGGMFARKFKRNLGKMYENRWPWAGSREAGVASWGEVCLGRTRRGGISHGMGLAWKHFVWGACGMRGGAWEHSAREKFHMEKAPHGENLYETRAARKTKSMGKFHKGKIPHGKNPTWENPTWATFHMANIPPTWGTSTVSRRRRINFTSCETKLKQDNRMGPPLYLVRCARFALRARSDGISINLQASW